jgi:hypothetical protein
MNRAHVLVEGQTEEAFVGRVVAPHLWNFGVVLSAKVVETRRVRSGANFKGGVNSWNQVARDVRLLLGDSGVVAVTTLLDYYALPNDVPGMADRPTGAADQAVAHVQAAMDAAVSDARFRAHLQLHEFEALLFSDPGRCGAYLGNDHLRTVMEQAVAHAGGPEFVNDDPATAPSKRILGAHPGYAKTADGPSLAEEIGLDAIRDVCPHFDGWISWLESL